MKRLNTLKCMIRPYLSVMAKGMCVGGSMLVPGVSGGSMAMILGIYDRLIDAVSSFTEHISASIRFLTAFCISAGLGMVLFARPLLRLIERYPDVCMYFFLGAVAGSLPMIFRKAKVKKFEWNIIVYPLVGLLLMGGIAILPKNLFSVGDRSSFFSYLPMILTGIVVAVALVLPGISVSYMLLVLGLYEETIEAVSHIDLLFLMPLGAGLILGIFLTTSLLEAAMKNYPKATYLIILGFIVASCIDVFPGIPTGIHFIFAILMFFCGAAMIAHISKE